jgi:hypothetical protein
VVKKAECRKSDERGLWVVASSSGMHVATAASHLVWETLCSLSLCMPLNIISSTMASPNDDVVIMMQQGMDTAGPKV